MPVNSHVIMKQLKQLLFGAEERRIQDWIDKLAEANNRIHGVWEYGYGFLHEGSAFKPSWISPTGPWQKKALHADLHEEMRAFVRDLGTVVDDQSFVSQVLFNLLGQCHSINDIRDTMPECIVALVPEWNSIPRNRDPAFTIRMNQRAYRQYERILPKIHLYATAKLIY